MSVFHQMLFRTFFSLLTFLLPSLFCLFPALIDVFFSQDTHLHEHFFSVISFLLGGIVGEVCNGTKQWYCTKQYSVFFGRFVVLVGWLTFFFNKCVLLPEQWQWRTSAGCKTSGKNVWGKGFRVGISEQTPLAVLLGEVCYISSTPRRQKTFSEL